MAKDAEDCWCTNWFDKFDFAKDPAARSLPRPSPPIANDSKTQTTTTPTSSSSTTSTGATAGDSPPPASGLSLENNPTRTGYDPALKWWVNYAKILCGCVSKEGAFHYREDRYRVHEERDVRRVEADRDWLFQYSPVVRFLREKAAALNGPLDETNVVCRRCPAHIRPDGTVARQSGGFSPAHGILVCSNEIRNRKHLEEVLAHEMVHAWDHLRWKVDWAGEQSLRHAACTEIRASMLSGECRWSKETFTRGNWHLSQQFQNCVRLRATQSVMARPTCKDDVQAVRVVNEVWDSCFSDKRPFEEVYQ